MYGYGRRWGWQHRSGTGKYSDSSVWKQIRHVVLDTLENLGVQNVKIKIVDKGALDCTIRARVEAAVYRSAGQSEQLPWGGAIR